MNRFYATVSAGLVLAMIAAPVQAGTTIEGVVNGPSTAVNFQSQKVPVLLGPGDRIEATLVYTGDALNDLDLTLFSPFYDSVPLTGTILSGDVDAIVTLSEHYAAQRLGRTTCTDATAASQGHNGADGGVESIDVTLGADAESGEYALNVMAYLSFGAIPYSLSITVTDSSGTDVTDLRVGDVIDQGVLNAWAYCDAAVRGLV